MAYSSESKQRGYIPPQNDEEKLLMKRVTEWVHQLEYSDRPRCTSFLSDREQALAVSALQKCKWTEYVFSGGYDAAERKLLCIYSGEKPEEPFPARCLNIEVLQKDKTLSHRDYLGALLSLGIKRECVGDILVTEDGAQCFVLEKQSGLVLEELLSVGRCHVHVSYAQTESVSAPAGREFTVSLASMRLDALLAEMIHTSRSNAVQLIRGGAVEINHIPSTKPHEPVYEGDTFSVRGYGKFRLQKIGEQSRKGRTFVSYLQY